MRQTYSHGKKTPGGGVASWKLSSLFSTLFSAWVRTPCRFLLCVHWLVQMTEGKIHTSFFLLKRRDFISSWNWEHAFYHTTIPQIITKLYLNCQKDNPWVMRASGCGILTFKRFTRDLCSSACDRKSFYLTKFVVFLKYLDNIKNVSPLVLQWPNSTEQLLGH